MSALPIAPATSSSIEPERAVATLTLAFSTDPISRWFFPEGSSYLTHFPEVLSLMADVAVHGGSVDGTGADAGAALWHGPGSELDDEMVGAVIHAGVDPHRHEVAFDFLTQMAEHHPTEPHWYLPVIGVDPTRQGEGHGSRLLEHALERCDRDGLPAYLEATNARNLPLYERHGFVAFAEIQVADSPPVWPMLRPAQ